MDEGGWCFSQEAANEQLATWGFSSPALFFFWRLVVYKGQDYKGVPPHVSKAQKVSLAS